MKKFDELADEILGRSAVDKVSGFEGVVTSVSLDLSGCLQALIMPAAKDGNELIGSAWFDTSRIELGDMIVLPEPINPAVGPVDKPTK